MVSGLLSVLVLTRRAQQRLIFSAAVVYESVLLLLVVLAGLQGEVAIAAIALVVSAAALAVTWRAHRPTPPTQPWGMVLVLGAIALLTFSVGSHASAAPGSVWAILLDYVHLLAAAAWIGGLVLLPILIAQLRRSGRPIDHAALWAIVRRYSYLASFAVFVLIVTGVFNSLIELPNLDSSVHVDLWPRALDQVVDHRRPAGPRFLQQSDSCIAKPVSLRTSRVSIDR